MTGKRIVIVGAGASGLAAASRLVQLGIQPQYVTILEAQPRIGGRIHTHIEGERPLELGAQWVHGECGNVVFEMASTAGELKTNQQTLESTGMARNLVFKFEGASPLTREQVEEFFDLLEIIWESFSSQELANWDTSLGEYVFKRYEMELERGGMASLDHETKLALLDWFQLLQNRLDGSDDWMMTSGAGQAHYHECPGDRRINWKRGYSSLFDILLKDIPKSSNGRQIPLFDRIHLNKPVRRIDWDPQEDGVDHIKVTCEDGSVFGADYVLVTCSLGVLKADAQSLFTPALPPQKLWAIECLGFGTVNKIYLKFKAPWWNEEWGGICFLHDRKLSSRTDWTDSISGFFTVVRQPKLLVAWITGPAARQMETLSDDHVMTKCSNLLRRFVYTDFPNYSEPVDIIRSKWSSNPYVLGSYSFHSMKASESNVWASDLAQPVYDSKGSARLFFAGEATHDRFFSTVHGAVESGFREAENIAKYCIGGHAKL